MHPLTSSVCVTLTIFFNFLRLIHGDSCPADKDNLHRLNKTRFFIVQRLGSLDETVYWSGAQAKCEGHGLKLATINSYGEDVTVGRALEKYVQENNFAIGIEPYAKYWIDAKYNNDEESYMWVAEKKKLNYFNILYKSKAVGYGNDLSTDGNQFKPLKRGPQLCLTYGLSYIKPGKVGDAEFLGYETRMEEKECEGGRKRYALCEAKKEDCPNPDATNAFLMTDTKDYYLNKGNWLFGSPRRFAVNWEPRKMPDAIKYCQDRGMNLYRPSNTGDGCLIPYLALWNKRITTATFWTRIKFVIGTNKYLWPNGEEIFIGKPYTNATTRKFEEVYACVMSAYSYEALGSNSCRCQWNSLILAAANCGIKMATICSHVKKNSNDTLGSCGSIWGSGDEVYDFLDNNEGRQKIVNTTHSLPFGSDKRSETLYRSTYKQIYGPRLCEPGYSMATTTTDIPLPDDKMLYKYDAQEDYWVVERLRGFFIKGNVCSLSVYDAAKNTRSIKTGVNCNEWHFYICELKS